MISPLCIATGGYLNKTNVAIATRGYICVTDVIRKILTSSGSSDDILPSKSRGKDNVFNPYKAEREQIHKQLIQEDNELLDIILSLTMGRII